MSTKIALFLSATLTAFALAVLFGVVTRLSSAQAPVAEVAPATQVTAVSLVSEQPAPTTPGEFTRCILESLALLYRHTLEQLEACTGHPVTTLHIVGGGSQNLLLNQFSANATGRTVIAGPAEATATGNILIQALALGQLKNLAELRQVVCNSCAGQTYQPQDAAIWAQAYGRFQKLIL